MPATRRNPLTTWLVPTLCFAAAPPLGNYLGTTPFRFAPNAAILAGAAISAMFLMAMIRELETMPSAQPGDTKLVWWHWFIPIYGLYWAAVIVPRAVAAAKKQAGKPAPRSAVAYLFVLLYALAADLNDLAE